ncbi:MAG TPA: HEAT repeat domain-containing protein [Verrucomicrobiae bacterium]|nr:HEAT repeat domain-containing protein [Verrucomicrobiae bacterium]
MHRGVKVAIWIWLAVLLSAVILWFAGRREPDYNGKPLTSWLQNPPLFSEEADDETSDSGRAAVAVRHIGTNAVPYLARLVRVKDSPFKTLVLSALPSFHSAAAMLRPAKETREMAAFGFYALGPMGKGAVPALTESLQDRDAGVVYHAARSLGFIGPDAEPAIPRLLALVHHPNRTIAWTAISSLAKIRKEPAVVVPTFITNLLSTNVILHDRTLVALGDFGEQAKAATPFILPFLNDADEMTRWDASNALTRINSETATKQPSR